jgi:hypothetical protein
MRKSIFIIFSFLFISSLGNAQKGALLEKIGKSDLSSLSKLMEPSIDFCINDGQQNIKKESALKLIKDFLNEVNPRSCRIVHGGDSKENGSYYEVGKLKTAKGNYRVFVYYENKKVVEFRIDNY